ncbi:hypothetical protein [Actinophytocola sp. NPDC049390]|uniref:hypothetical protein n=1 Tax=Actinophytocola sp. NPDC049390 TaxID=3363894 RepID=UPI0037ADF211
MNPSYDVDQFGILEQAPTADREPDRQSQVTDRHDGTPASPMSVSGNSNVTSAGDMVALFMGDSALEFYARAAAGKRQGRGLLDHVALLQLKKNYVAPTGLLSPAEAGDQSALMILQEHRVLVLTARNSDGGQFAAGLRLGYSLQSQEPDLVVREELIDAEFRLMAEDILIENEPAVVLVDLRGSPDVIRLVQHTLVEFTQELEKHSSYLIVIAPYDLFQRFQSALPGRVHELAKPPYAKVLQRYLGGDDITATIDSTDLHDQLEQLWPPQLKEIADIVADRLARGEDVQQALREAMAAHKIDLRAVIRHKQEENESEWLSLLLSAALLEGASPEHIVNAADKMLETNGLKVKSDVVPLLRLSAHARLRDLDTVPFDPDIREFGSRGFGTHVLRHFWREHPILRKNIEAWIGQIPRYFSDLSQGELERIADRAADLATEAGYLLAVTLAEKWASASTSRSAQAKEADSYRRSVAVRLLITVSTDTALGRQTRNRLLTWSKEGGTDLQLLTAHVCEGLGESYPRIALTRLKHLANSDDDDVRDAVLSAMQRIGVQLGMSSFLRYLSEWFDKATPPRLRMLTEAVSAVLADQAENIDTEAAESFWSQAIGVLSPEELHSAVSAWLSTAATMPIEQHIPMVEALVRATKSEYHRIIQLQYASRIDRRLSLDLRPLGDKPIASVLDLLWTRLDEVHPVWLRG